MTTPVREDQGAGKALETTGAGATPAPAKGTLASMLDNAKTSIAAALPRGLDAGRFLRIVQTELRKNPKLAATTPPSFLGAVLTAAQLGLDVGSATGQAYLVPYRNHGRDEAQLIIGYPGWLTLIYRGGQIAKVEAREVCANDSFDYRQGTDAYLHHKAAEGERGKVTHYYCLAKIKGGDSIFEVMTVAQVEKHRDRYAKKVNGAFVGPWASNFDEMALKTAFKRVHRWLPKSAEQNFAASVDEGIVFRDLSTPGAEPEVEYPEAEVIDPDTGEVIR